MTSDVAKEMRIRNYEDLRTWPSFGTFIYSTFHLDKKIYLDYNPKTEMRLGLANFVKWFRDYKKL